MTSNASGMTSNASGMTSNASGMTSNASGMTSNASGMTSNASGMTSGMSSGMTSGMTTDTIQMLQTIETHPNRSGIFSMFKKGPPIGKGFMWGSHKDMVYWTEDESNGLKYVSDMVLDKGWDSSGFGIMMRNLQYEINKAISV
jgi:hypothetical protein